MQTYEFIWESVLKAMRGTYTDVKIKQYFKDVRIVEIDSLYILLMTPASDTLDYVRSERRNLEKLISGVMGEFKIVYVYAYDRDISDLERIREDIKDDLDNPQYGKTPYQAADDRREARTKEKPSVSTQERAIRTEAPSKNAKLPSKLDYTFENYVVGSSNRFVYNACYAVATNPSYTWNPLFVYGPSGLGKTHLMYAITNEILKNTPDMKLIYVNGEEFTNQMIESLRTRDGPAAFRAKYRNCDVLLIDDIHFIAGKVAVQEEFFHTFNALYEEHKQIILTSDRPAREIKPLEERLQTRFEMGLNADIQPPDYELRVAIIKNKAEAYNLVLPDASVSYLAEHLTKNIRQIEGALKKIFARSYLYGADITEEMVIRSVADLITIEISPKDLTEKILLVTSSKYHITRDELCGKSKKREAVMARHISVYLIRKLTNYSLKQIGSVFTRDHTTIMNSVDVMKKQIMNDPVFEREITDLENEIRE